MACRRRTSKRLPRARGTCSSMGPPPGPEVDAGWRRARAPARYLCGMLMPRTTGSVITCSRQRQYAPQRARRRARSSEIGPSSWPRRQPGRGHTGDGGAGGPGMPDSPVTTTCCSRISLGGIATKATGEPARTLQARVGNLVQESKELRPRTVPTAWCRPTGSGGKPNVHQAERRRRQVPGQRRRRASTSWATSGTAHRQTRLEIEKEDG